MFLASIRVLGRPPCIFHEIGKEWRIIMEEQSEELWLWHGNLIWARLVVYDPIRS